MPFTPEDIKDIIQITLISSGVLTIVITSISNFFLHRALKKRDNNDNLKEEFRKKKMQALDILFDRIDLDDNTYNMEYIHIPLELCPAKKIGFKTIFPTKKDEKFTNVSEMKVILASLRKYRAKYQLWLDNELNESLKILDSFLEAYIIYCENGKITPNHLVSVLLQQDIYVIFMKIYKQVKKSYFQPIVDKKYRFPYSKKSYKKLYDFSRKSNLAKIMVIVDEDHNRIKELNENPYHSQMYKHANLCKNCKLECELAGLYFSDNKSIESEG